MRVTISRPQSLHLAGSESVSAVEDPTGLLEWLAKDRCAVKFHDLKEVKANKAAFHEIVRQWIAHR